MSNGASNMNPVIAVLAEYSSKGQRISRVRPIGEARHPYGFVVTPEKGPEFTHRLETESRDEFMRIWRDAVSWWRIKWEYAPE